MFGGGDNCKLVKENQIKIWEWNTKTGDVG